MNFKFAIAASAIAVADEHLAGQDKGLCLRSGVGQAAVHEELVESDLALPRRDGRAHRLIVAQAAARGLTANRAPTVDQRWSVASFLDIDAKYGSPLIADRNLSCQVSTRWYLTCGLPWRRQYLLTPPGTRKSAT